MSAQKILLPSGHAFESELITREVDGQVVALALSASRDPITDATTSQLIASVDGTRALQKTLRVEGRACDAVIDFAPALGGGRLTLHWALMPEAAGLLAHGHGTWNGAEVQEFGDSLALDADGRALPRDESRFGALRLDGGGFAEPGAQDHATAWALGELAKAVLTESATSLASCLAEAAACLLAAPVAALAHTGPGLAAATKRCALIESAGLVVCAARD